MFEFDFAFFTMTNSDRRGLAFKKKYLDRLAPLFFGPRVQNLIDFSPLGLKGCSILLPLGPGNWNTLDAPQQEILLKRSQQILENYQVAALAVDRTCKKQLLQLSTSYPLLFGDNFIKTLALAAIRFYLNRQALKRLVVVGDMADMSVFIENLKQFDLPVSIQSYIPTHYEVMAYHLLYEKGIAVSTSYLNPRGWEAGDAVIIVESGYGKYVPMAARGVALNLTDESMGLAPQLEEGMKRGRITPALSTLAPVLESCLLNQAGIRGGSSEELSSQVWGIMEQQGDRIGLWDYFLDKA